MEAKENKQSQSHPRQLKNELNQKINNPQCIENLTLTRQRKFVQTTKNIQTTTEILQNDSLLRLSFNSFLCIETITSRFLF